MCQITSTNWMEYLCDFLELEKGTSSTDHTEMIKHGQYYKLSIYVKLEILRGLVNWALLTDAIKGQLEAYIGEMQALKAAKREEDVEEQRKRREEKRLKEMTSDNDNSLQENGVSECTGLQSFDFEHSCEQTKVILGDVNIKVQPSNETHHLSLRYDSNTLLCIPAGMLTRYKYEYLLTENTQVYTHACINMCHT